MLPEIFVVSFSSPLHLKKDSGRPADASVWPLQDRAALDLVLQLHPDQNAPAAAHRRLVFYRSRVTGVNLDAGNIPRTHPRIDVASGEGDRTAAGCAACHGKAVDVDRRITRSEGTSHDD